MNISLDPTARQFQSGVAHLHIISDIHAADDGIRVAWKQADRLTVSFDGTNACLQGQNRVQFFRGLGILNEKIKEHGTFTVTQTPVFQQLGASFDLSRNAVMTPNALERMLCRMALMGFTEAYLYTEDTYELPDYPFFGYMRGRYSAEDIRHLDKFAADLGIELIPCIQTLGHLERFLHWESSASLRDTPDVLLVGDKNSEHLIEAMIAQCRKCYHTHKIHVGMDEAMNLGLGRYLKKNGFKNSFSIMQQHVRRVADIAEKYDFQPMMWSDMYFRCASPTNDYYENDITIPSRVMDSAPDNMELVYWDYYHDHEDFYDRYIKLHQQFKAPLRFAGGMWTWLGPAIDYDVFFKNTAPALRSCLKNGVQNVMITTWGDDGGETSPQAMLLGLQAYAEFCYEATLEKKTIFKRLYACTGADAEALYRISRFNKTPLLGPASDLPNAAKFLLYQDPLTGIFDQDIDGMGFAQQYAELEVLFRTYAQRGDAWEPLYRFYMLLAKVLKNKAELGISLYHAYQEKNMPELKKLALQAKCAGDDCAELLEQWRTLWLTECRSFGFEVIEIRLAGVRSRLLSTYKRVLSYCHGEILSIEELEHKRLPLLRKEDTNDLHGVYFWRDIVSASKPY